MLTSKIIVVTSPGAVFFNRNEIGPYFVLTSMIYYNAFVIFLQVGKQNRSYLSTKQFSAISRSLMKNVKWLEKTADVSSLMLLLSFPANFLLTPLFFPSIKNYTLVFHIMFMCGICFCFIIICFSIVTKRLLEPQLTSILKSNDKRIQVEPLNRASLKKQNQLIKSILFQEAIQAYYVILNLFLTLLFLALNMPLQYIFHPINLCFFTAGEMLVIVKPFLLVCDSEKAKYKKNKKVVVKSTIFR